MFGELIEMQCIKHCLISYKAAAHISMNWVLMQSPCRMRAFLQQTHLISGQYHEFPLLILSLRGVNLRAASWWLGESNSRLLYVFLYVWSLSSHSQPSGRWPQSAVTRPRWTNAPLGIFGTFPMAGASFTLLSCTVWTCSSFSERAGLSILLSFQISPIVMGFHLNYSPQVSVWDYSLKSCHFWGAQIISSLDINIWS